MLFKANQKQVKRVQRMFIKYNVLETSENLPNQNTGSKEDNLQLSNTYFGKKKLIP